MAYMEDSWAKGKAAGFHTPPEKTDGVVQGLKTIYDVLNAVDGGEGVTMATMMGSRGEVQGMILERRGMTM